MTKQDVLIIGGGPAGLATAISLRKQGIQHVLVVDREKDAGGVPRHCHHTGFGIRDRHRILSGPDYARAYVQDAERLGVEILNNTMVTGWLNDSTVQATSPNGITNLQAQAIVLATGCRERPRSARLIPGARLQGIFTTGSLQQWVYINHHEIGKRAIVVGAEHVSFSAVMTLKHAGTDVACMITDLPQHQTYFPYKLVSADRYRVPILTQCSITNILGSTRVEAIEVYNQEQDTTEILDCDTLVFTGDWIPDHELARLGNLQIDASTRGPRIDTQWRTSQHGVFAVGNLIHAAETADRAALTGKNVAPHIVRFLEDDHWQADNMIFIETDEVIQWISPQQIDMSKPYTQPFKMRVRTVLHSPTLQISQGETILWQRHYRRLIPNLPIHIPPVFLSQLKPNPAQPAKFQLKVPNNA